MIPSSLQISFCDRQALQGVNKAPLRDLFPAVPCHVDPSSLAGSLSLGAAGKSPASFGDVSAFAGRVSAFIRAKHRAKAPDAVSAETGGLVSAEQVRKWFSGSSAPGAPALLSLVLAYGPEFLAAALDGAPEWLSDAVLSERRRRLEIEGARIARELAIIRGCE